MRLFSALLGLAFLATGCRNNCQQLCVEMKNFAEECGFETTKDELKACIEEHSNKEVSKSGREICRDEIDALRDEWTCDEVEDAYTQPAEASDTDA